MTSPAGVPARRRSRRLRRVLGGLLVLSAVLVATELLLRSRMVRVPALFDEVAPGRVTIAPRWVGFAELNVPLVPEHPRVVWMGASTEMGFPFGELTARSSPAAWVQRILGWRGADVEVVCVACPGLMASETLDLFPEVLKLNPVAVVVGTAQNEYLRTDYQLGWRWLNRLQLMHRLRVLIWSDFSADQLPTEDDDFDDAAIAAELGETLRALQRAADEAGVQLLVTVPVSNLSDMPPILGDDPRLPESPDAAWDRGRQLLAAGDLEGARAALVQARDTDRWPHRATSALIDVVLSSVRNPVRTDLAFERASPTGIPGDDLFVDHCHPSPAGSRVLALTVADALENLGVIPLTGHGGQAPTLEQLCALAGITPEAEARGRVDVARAFVLFALHTRQHGRMAEVAAAALDACDPSLLHPGEAETVHALLALLRGDVAAAKSHLDEVRRTAPGMLGTLSDGYAGFRWIREAFERAGLDFDEATRP